MKTGVFRFLTWTISIVFHVSVSWWSVWWGATAPSGTRHTSITPRSSCLLEHRANEAHASPSIAVNLNNPQMNSIRSIINDAQLFVHGMCVKFPETKKRKKLKGMRPKYHKMHLCSMHTDPVYKCSHSVAGQGLSRQWPLLNPQQWRTVYPGQSVLTATNTGPHANVFTSGKIPLCTGSNKTLLVF